MRYIKRIWVQIWKYLGISSPVPLRSLTCDLLSFIGPFHEPHIINISANLFAT
jgi:hypothetical protein